MAKTNKTGPLPLRALLQGHRARRANWAEGAYIFVGEAGGRGGTRKALMIAGSRTGELPYTSQLTDDADLLATDWETIVVEATS